MRFDLVVVSDHLQARGLREDLLVLGPIDSPTKQPVWQLIADQSGPELEDSPQVRARAVPLFEKVRFLCVHRCAN